MNEKEEIRDVQDIDFGFDMSGETARDSKKTIATLIRYLMKQKWKLLIVFVCTVIAAVFMVLSPKVLGKAINTVYDGIQNAIANKTAFEVNMQTIGMILAELLFLYTAEAAANYVQQEIMSSVSQTLILTLRKEVSAKMNRLPLSYFDRHQKGEILSLVSNDLEKIGMNMQDSLTQLFSSIISIVGAAVMMIMIDPFMTIFALLAIFVSMIVAFFISKKTEKSFSDNQEALSRLNGSIEESFSGNLVVKAFNLEEQMIDTIRQHNEKLYKAGSKATFMTYCVSPLIRLINQFGYVAVAVYGAMKVISQTITIGDIQAFIQYVNQISEPVTQVSYIYNSLQSSVASAERVFDLLGEEEESADKADAPVLDHPKGNVVFEHIRFGYTEERILMEDVSIDVKAGSKIAIVGPTGAGKTTLVNLLMRFYDLISGKITIDGIDIAEMKRSDLRSMMGMVLQDTWLFNGTIKENIAYGNRNASDKEIYAAAKAARADHFIRTMPQGYNTILNDELTSLSQGQKQLLTIARAILADPQILILDEATSSVDTRTELEIQKAMDTLMKEKTSFVIAHRLSTIRNADRILVMNHGSIIEQGNHDELMKQNGFYADLYNSQFALKAADRQ